MSTELRSSDGAAGRVADLADDLAGYQRRYEAERSPRAVFTFAYRTITNDLANRLADADAGFDDRDWIADLAVAFGERYKMEMDAIDEWEREHDPDDDPGDELYRSVSRPWVDVYRAICHERSTVTEELVFAMGAHITHDLPYALLEVDTGTDRLYDYHLMNDVLASNTDAVQDAVTNRYNRSLGELDLLAGGADEFFTNYWMRIGRSLAWYNAKRMQSPAARPGAEASIERAVSGLIESVRTAGPWPIRLGLKKIRIASVLVRRWPDPEEGSIDGTLPSA